MKNLVICIAVLVLSISVFSNTSYAYEWHSDEGMYYMFDEEYQIECTIEACINRYGYTENAKKCSLLAGRAYQTMMESINLLLSARDQGHVIADGEFCVERSIEKYWDSSRNTANWYRVHKYTSECLDLLE
jgi:hypothetical protein